MSDYSRTTASFAALQGADADPAVFDAEFAALVTASASKMDKTGGTFTGAINVPAGASVNNAMRYSEVIAQLIPATTKMSFFQAAAPTGWTQDVTNTDALLRVVDGVGGSTGGVGAISTGSTAITDSHILTKAEIPAHIHTVPNSGSQNNSFDSGTTVGNDVAGNSGDGSADGLAGGGHTHNIAAWVPKYIDMIVCTKDAY